jgi:hypothetical protein
MIAIKNPRWSAKWTRSRLVWICCIVLLVALLGAFAARPATVLSVNGDALEQSVGHGLHAPPPCDHLTGSTWECLASDPQLLSVTDLRVTVDSFGCWTAVRSEGGTERRSGCVTIVDYF